jgi:hypothetical protein
MREWRFTRRVLDLGCTPICSQDCKHYFCRSPVPHRVVKKGPIVLINVLCKKRWIRVKEVDVEEFAHVYGIPQR